MQDQDEIGKWVTDEKHVYPYNAFLDEAVAAGKLRFCEKPAPRAATAKDRLVVPTLLSPEERGALTERLGITMQELLNMSPEELAEAKAEHEAAKQEVKEAAGFPS